MKLKEYIFFLKKLKKNLLHQRPLTQGLLYNDFDPTQYLAFEIELQQPLIALCRARFLHTAL